MPRKTDRHRKRSDLTAPAESLPGKTKERKSSEQVQDIKASFGVSRGYFVLGVFLICVAVFIPFYLYFESSIPVTIVTVASQPPQSSECAVATQTITGSNGETHRHYNVTCSLTVGISAIPNNATLPFTTKNALSSASYAISLVSTIATVAVALAVIPIQNDSDKCKTRIDYALIATCLLSIAVVLAIFLLLAQPLNAVTGGQSLCIGLLMSSFTLAGYGFSILSWGRLRTIGEQPLVSSKR
jgi:hypothetical protein